MGGFQCAPDGSPQAFILNTLLGLCVVIVVMVIIMFGILIREMLTNKDL